MAHYGNGTLDEEEVVAPVPGILAMADCFEPDSANQRLIDLAIGCVAAMGTDVTILDLRDLELPQYDDTVDVNDLPQGAHAFRQLLCAHDGFLVALPSQDGTYPPLLMNAIAWSVCPAFGKDSAAAYNGKCASLMSATGKSEILENLLSGVREKLSRLGVLVLPEVLILPAPDAANGSATTAAVDPHVQLEQQMQRFVGTIRWAQSRIDL